MLLSHGSDFLYPLLHLKLRQAVCSDQSIKEKIIQRLRISGYVHSCENMLSYSKTDMTNPTGEIK